MNRTANLGRTTYARSLITVAVSAALGTGAAYAEDAQGSADTLQEVLVTATKRTESVQDIPISITAISGEALVQRGITDVLTLDHSVPGLILENSGNDPTPILRGAGVAGTTDVAVPFYVDGVYQPNAGQGLVSFLDLERVEVLKGPQGTLFGRNTLGGLINLVSHRPDLEKFDFGAAVTFGDYSERKIEGFVNLPFAEQFALRLTGAAEKRDPFVKNVYNPSGGLKDANYSYARAQLLWKPLDTLVFDLTGTYWHDTSNGNNDFGLKVVGIPVNATTHQVNGINGFLDPRQGLRTGWGGGKAVTGNISNGDTSAAILPSPYEVAWDYKPHRNIKETSSALDVKWQITGHELHGNFAIFDYSELRLADGDLSTKSAYVAGNLINTKSHQLDVNLNSNWSTKFKYTLGFYLFDDSKTTSNSSAFLFGYTYTTPQKPTWAYFLYQDVGGTKSTAEYGQAEYSLFDKLSVVGGLRHTQDKRNSYQLNIIPSSENDVLPSFGGSPVNISNGTADHTDFRYGLNYKLDKDVLLYASVATGYIAGATQQLTNKLLAPNTVRTLELGAKTTSFDDRLRFNVAVYSATYDGLTTTIFVPVGNTILSQQVPGGNIRSSGIEIEGAFLPVHGLEIDYGVAADRSTFDHFTAADRLGTDGASFVTPSGKGEFILNGQPTSFSPDLTANLGATYDIRLGDHGSISPAAFIKYSSAYKLTSEPYFWSTQASFAVADLAATWRSVDGKISVKAYVNNVGNKAVAVAGTVYSGSRAVEDFSNPRFWGVRIGYNF